MARLNLPIVSIIFNNDVLAWIKHIQEKRFKNQFISTDFHHIDFASVARGFGVRGHTARTGDELAAALQQEQGVTGPAVIDVITDQWETPVLRSSSLG
jgi:acetolactate synthase-1/2/3 large subunit